MHFPRNHRTAQGQQKSASRMGLASWIVGIVVGAFVGALTHWILGIVAAGLVYFLVNPRKLPSRITDDGSLFSALYNWAVGPWLDRRYGRNKGRHRV